MSSEALKHWKTMNSAWKDAHQSARAARASVTAQFALCAARQGPDPTVEQLQECDRLERLADKLSVELENLATKLS